MKRDKRGDTQNTAAEGGKGWGGSRPGAGRPSIEEEGCSWESRAVSKTVTLTAEQWAWLEQIADNGRPSTAIKGLMRGAKNRTPNGEKIEGLKYRPEGL